MVGVLDTTLRDGLRNSGIKIELGEKVRFARELERLGIDVLEIGFGGPEEVEPMRRIAGALTRTTVLGLSRVNLKDVTRVLKGVETAKKPGINIFAPTSEAFLRHSKASREQVLEAAVEAIVYAKRHLDHVQFPAQDATRSDPHHLARAFTAALSTGATGLCVTDTTSHALPGEFGALCERLRTQVADGDRVAWSVHCHNELGLGVANCLAAVAGGVRQVECTVNGVGEGAGNTPLAPLVRALREREEAFGFLRTNVSFDQLDAAAALLAEVAAAA
jgi:2-isopropylmalate synthase